jgi:hypothetical protein
MTDITQKIRSLYMRTGRILLVILLILFLGGSALAAQKAVFSPPAEKQKIPPASPAPQKLVSASPAAKPGIVAVVNGTEISLNDFVTELYRAERAVLDGGKLLSASQVTRLKTEVLEALIRQELLYQESKKIIRLTDAEVKEETEKLKGQFQTDADFVRASSSLRPQVERTVSIRKYIDSTYSSKAQVTDTDIRSYYDSHRDAFRVPEQVKAGYIFMRIDDEAKKEEAKRKIEDVRKKALAGQDFASLAKTYSGGPHRLQGRGHGLHPPGAIAQSRGGCPLHPESGRSERRGGDKGWLPPRQGHGAQTGDDRALREREGSAAHGPQAGEEAKGGQRLYRQGERESLGQDLPAGGGVRESGQLR